MVARRTACGNIVEKNDYFKPQHPIILLNYKRHSRILYIYEAGGIPINIYFKKGTLRDRVSLSNRPLDIHQRECRYYSLHYTFTTFMIVNYTIDNKLNINIMYFGITIKS